MSIQITGLGDLRAATRDLMDIRYFPALCGPVVPDHRMLTA
jgi:hypothetical protein